MQPRTRDTSLRLAAIAAMGAAACFAPAWADTVILRNGQRYEGKKVATAGGKVGYMVDGKLQWFAESDIAQVIPDAPDANDAAPTTPIRYERQGGQEPLAPAHPLFRGDRVTVDLPEASAKHVVGGGGRFLIFHLKEAKKVAILDTSRGQLVKEIPDVPDGALLAAGRDKLILVMPGQDMLQRWSLETFEREKVIPVPGAGTARVALMGCDSDGPLLLGSDGPCQLLDLGTLRPLAFPPAAILGTSRQYPTVFRVSADGKTFTGIPSGIGPVAYAAMRIQGGRTVKGSFGGTSHAIRWAQPTADGGLLLMPGGGIFSAGLKPVVAKELEGSTCYPTPDPAYFLSVRFQGDKTHASICTTADRRVLHTVVGLEEMAPRGNTNERSSIANKLHSGEPNFHYFPAMNVIATIHWDARRVALRRFILAETLEKEGGSYLYVISAPPPVAAPGRAIRYQIEVQSKAGEVKYELASGPPGAQVSPTGLVVWVPPRVAKDDTATILIRITDKSGREIFHSIQLAIEKAAGR